MSRDFLGYHIHTTVCPAQNFSIGNIQICRVRDPSSGRRKK